MINIFINESLNKSLLKEEINVEIFILEILEKYFSINNHEISINIDEKNLAQFFYFWIGDIKNFVIISSKDYKDSRNTFVAQPFSNAYIKIYSEINEKTRIYFLSRHLKNSIGSLPNSIISMLRILKTLGVILIGFQNFTNFNITEFKDSHEYINAKEISGKRNKNNKPTIFIATNEKIEIYGKFGGANSSELICSIFLFMCFRELEGKTIYVNKINNDVFTKNEINFFKNNNIWIDYSEEIISANNISEDSNYYYKVRNQMPFKKNIIIKYGLEKSSKCFVCDCKITEILIFSHIKPIHMIEKELNDSNTKDVNLVEKAKKEAISGDNGFVFCRNHDKMFEDGLIYFDYKKGKFEKNINISPIILEYILSTWNGNVEFKEEWINDEFIKFVDLKNKSKKIKIN